MATMQQQGWQAGFLGTPHFDHLNTQMQRCIQECLSCFTVCEQTLQHCLRKGGRYVEAEHVKLLVDCAESCRMSAAMMSRESRYHGMHCAMCAEICKACEESCERFGDDAQMKACADACRSCSDACRKMSVQS
jgi:uncharacterized protein DUF326